MAHPHTLNIHYIKHQVTTSLLWSCRMQLWALGNKDRQATCGQTRQMMQQKSIHIANGIPDWVLQALTVIMSRRQDCIIITKGTVLPWVVQQAVTLLLIAPPILSRLDGTYQYKLMSEGHSWLDYPLGHSNRKTRLHTHTMVVPVHTLDFLAAGTMVSV